MKFRYKTPPRSYQVPALKQLVRQRGGALQVKMRWGKTWVAINFAAVMAVQEQRTLRVLVICPATVTGVWASEVAKHCPVHWSMAHADGGPQMGLGEPQNGDRAQLDWHIVNYEATYGRAHLDPDNSRAWTAVPDAGLDAYGADIVIVDESHHIGDPTTLQSKYAYRLGQRARYRLIMTGTMFDRKPLYTFGQFKFYDDAIFGTRYSHFRRRIAIMGGYGNYEVIGYRDLQWMMNRIKPVTFISKDVPSAPPVHQLIKFELTGSGKQVYDDMEKHDVVDVNGDVVVAPIVLTRHLRLQQIAGGWLTASEGGYVRVGKDKKQAFAALLGEYADQDIAKVVVGCRFIPELRDVADAAKKIGYRVVALHGGIRKGLPRDRRIAAFNETERPCIFVSQVSAGKEGIDLSSASNLIWYSLPESYVDFVQFSARIERYHEKRTLGYDYLLARGTRDEVTYMALKLKANVSELIVKRPDLVEQIVQRAALKAKSKR